jgi:TonB family protein
MCVGFVFLIGKKLKISSSKLITLWVIGAHMFIIFGVGVFQEKASQTEMPERLTLNLKKSPNNEVMPQASQKTQSLNLTNRRVELTSANEARHYELSVSPPAVKNLRDRDVFINPKPTYPLLSRRMREQGAVHLKLCIDELGHVANIFLAKSSGYQKLDRSAIETVSEWRFSALESQNTPSSDCYHLPIHFRLES